MDLDDAIEAQHEAMKAIVGGDAGPAKAMYSPADDATLANPWGPIVHGHDAIDTMLEFVATRFRDGVCEGIERLAAYIDTNVATIVETERWRAKVGGSYELTPFELRVSTTYRREGEAWKIALRHADPLTTPRHQGPLQG